MNLIMKDHADKAWLLGRSTDKNPDFKSKLAAAVLFGLLVIILAFEYSPAAAEQEDLALYNPTAEHVNDPVPVSMVSPEIASFIKAYHENVDFYGVE